MAVILGDNRYGKAEIRVVRVARDGEDHVLTDLNVSVSLAGDLAGTHLTGDNAAVLPTDTQKNTVFAFAKEQLGSGQPIETFAACLAKHFVDSQPTIHCARVSIVEYAWQRLGPHSFARTTNETRTVSAVYGPDQSDGTSAWIVSGLADLVLLNSADSEFHGYLKDGYTTLPETTDRILATAVEARWRYMSPSSRDWNTTFDRARAALVTAFVRTYSYSLQQTLYAMGQHALDVCPEIAEIRLAMPNKHHFAVDLAPFGLTNDNEVFVAADRPYGLIEGTVLRDDAPEPGLAWW
jgi:urate oxidase